jgi:integrase
MKRTTRVKRTTADINELVKNIRAGRPPELAQREEHYYDPALPNFYIRLLNTGVATWTVQWKRLGRQKKIAIGNVLVLDRPEAITSAKQLLAKMTLGLLDPHEARRERMRANKVTFATLVPVFLERKIRQGKLRPSTSREWKHYLTGYHFEPLHNLPIDEITGEQIQTQIDQVAIQSGNTSSVNCWAVMSVFFKWAHKTGKLPKGHHNPMLNVEQPKRNAPRERVLTDDEIRLIWKTCEAWEVQAIHDRQIRASGTTYRARQVHGRKGRETHPDFPREVMLLFLTGCRAQEIGDLQWSEVDLDNGELSIPAARIKNEKDLCNPLSDLAVQILRRVERRPDRDNIFGYATRAGHNIAGTQYKINKRIADAGGTPPKNWTIHDIRRTVRSNLSALKVPKDIAERLLGHRREKIVDTYDKYEQWPEKRQALAMWEARLRAIIDGTAEKIARPNFGRRKEGSTT